MDERGRFVELLLTRRRGVCLISPRDVEIRKRKITSISLLNLFIRILRHRFGIYS